ARSRISPRAAGTLPLHRWMPASTEPAGSLRCRQHRRAGRPGATWVSDRSVAVFGEHGLDARGIAEEGVDASRVEMPAALRLQELDAFGERPGVLVGAFRDERVEHVGHGDDTRHQRDVLAVQSVRIAGAVELLVM